MNERGVKSILNEDIFALESGKYDTLLLLMNGIGLVGTLQRLETFLNHVKKLLAHDGQILLDSSYIMYLYEDIPMPLCNYYGELKYKYE